MNEAFTRATQRAVAILSGWVGAAAAGQMFIAAGQTLWQMLLILFLGLVSGSAVSTVVLLTLWPPNRRDDN